MKKLIGFTAGLLAGAALFAAGIENKSNLSPGYQRNPSRNAEAKRPEAAFYNIAGTAFLEDGLYIELGNQFVFKEYKNEMGDSDIAPINTAFSAAGLKLNSLSSTDNTTVVLYPSADIVFKKDKLAAFVNFGIYAGGGTLEFSEGTTPTALAMAGAAGDCLRDTPPQVTAAQGLLKAANDHSVKISSITYGEHVGVAYKVLDNVSVSAALRLLEGTQEMSLKSNHISAMNGGNEVSYKAGAFGVGGVFGVHAQPVEKLDLSLQYQTLTKLEYEVDDVKGTLASAFSIVDGNKFRTDLPAVLGFGAGYQVIEPLYLSLGFNWYFNKGAHQDSILGENDYKDSWDLTFGADFDINEMFSIGAGVSYAKQGVDDENNSSFSPVLSSLAFGIGPEIRPVKGLTITGGFMYVNYFDEDYKIKDYKTTLSKDLWMLAIGATYRLPM